jgi:hypothetical protein
MPRNSTPPGPTSKSVSSVRFATGCARRCPPWRHLPAALRLQRPGLPPCATPSTRTPAPTCSAGSSPWACRRTSPSSASDSLDASLRNLRNRSMPSLSFSFFITSEHEERPLRQRHAAHRHPARALRLPRPLRLLHRVRRKRRPRQKRQGAEPAEGSKQPGARITFTGAGGPPQTLYYFSTNLASWNIKQEPGFLRFCESLPA